MQANISISIQDSSTTPDDVRGILQEMESTFPEASFEIDDPEGGFPTPPPTDPYTLIIATNASVQLIAVLIPKLKDKLSGIIDDADVLNIEDVAMEYLEEHTRVSRGGLDLKNREVSENDVTFEYEYMADGSLHRITINRDDITNWEYEER